MDTEDNKTTDAAVLPAKGKSIIDPKYRGKYKTPDWLGNFIAGQASKTKVIPAKAAQPATEQVGTIGQEGFKPAKPATEATPERTVNDGVDVDKLFELGAKNGLNLEKFQTQRSSHGFDGRFRMTVRNMLQTVAKQRHGLIGLDGSFVSADPEFLRSKSAPANPTHNQDGSKIAVAKVAKEEPAAESKLIKASDTANAEANADNGEPGAPGKSGQPAAVAKKKK